MLFWRIGAVGGLVLSHLGWLGSPMQPITLRSAVGATMLLVGSIIATRQ